MTKYLCKTILLGNSNVGKSNIMRRITNKSFLPIYESTIGVDYDTCEISDDNYTIKLNIWDTAGQERFSSIIRNYYHNVDIVLLVYSKNDQKRFENITYWLNELDKYCIGYKCILIANKCDLKDQI